MWHDLVQGAVRYHKGIAGWCISNGAGIGHERVCEDCNGATSGSTEGVCRVVWGAKAPDEIGGSRDANV